MPSLLKLENLSCGYEGKEVIADASFSIEENSIVGIIGPNGAGKTTLFRAMTRLIKPTKGSVFYRGKKLEQIPMREFSREVAVLPQMLEVFFSFSVEEFVTMGRFPHIGRFERLKKADHEAIEEALTLSGIAHLRDRIIGRLSGGEWQKVMIAQALSQQPSLLFLDEPMSHLDIGHQMETLDLLKTLNEERGLTVMMILHDLNLAGEYCDRLLLLNNGKIYREGTPEEVLTYQVIEEVYKTIVVVKNNPISSKPHVLPIPKDQWRKKMKNGRDETSGLPEV